MLMISTLKHLGCDGNVTLTVMHGTHCAYVNALGKKGDSAFGKLVHNFIESKVRSDN